MTYIIYDIALPGIKPNSFGVVVSLTKQQAVYQRLKTLIVEGKLKPGERLIIDDLAREFGLSIIPVREALQLLQSDRLVEIRPHAGATVSPITVAHLDEIFTILEGLEAVTVRRLAETQPAAVLAKLEKIVAQLERATERADLEQWSALNMEFHSQMSAATHMPWLHEITTRALRDWDRVRRYFFNRQTAHRFAEAQLEHWNILQAVREGDAAQAEKIVRHHNQNALRHYRASLESAAGAAAH